MRTLIDPFLAHPLLTSFALVIACVCARHFWSFRICPLFIPKAEINATVDELIAEYGPRAEEIAFIEEARAWRYSQIYQQGRWRRVRRELWRRYEAGEWA